MSRPPIPPFTAQTAVQKVRLAEDAWNTRDPARVALAYSTDSTWRNRVEFVEGRDAIEAFLTRKWNTELDYRLIKELWAFRGNRIAVRFAYEWCDVAGQWYRSYGTRTGSSTRMASCAGVLPASTTHLFGMMSASTVGRSVAGPMGTWVCAALTDGVNAPSLE